MTTLAIAAFIFLALAGFVSWRHTGPDRSPLAKYIISVAVTWGIAVSLARVIGGPEKFHTFVLICAGFALGMVAMFIATHVYKP